MMRSRRSRRVAAVMLLLALLVVLAVGYRNATAAPVVRRLSLTARDYPAAMAPVRVVLFSDLHVHGPDMPPRRVAEIVQQINRLRPDVIIATGDFAGGNWIGQRYSPAEAIAPLRGLKAKLGVYAVLGNHDHRVDPRAVGKALKDAEIRVLVNEAVRVGPLALGGIDGKILGSRRQWQARRDGVYAALERTPGIKILAVHRPDEFNWTPSWVQLVLAGHTHCGQVVLPVVGALQTGSDFGQRFRCGVIKGRGNSMIVSAGLGTSRIPLRIGAPPDIWLIELKGPRSAA